MPEVIGSGLALFDMDNDGDLDLYLVQSGPSFDQPSSLRDQIFRNNLDAGLTGFTDVTERSGIQADGFGLGVAVADFDQNGWSDLFVTNFGANHLWLNQNGSHFMERAASAGIVGDSWNVSATVLDANRDGLSDLFLCGYLDYSRAVHKRCVNANSTQDYCGPRSYRAISDQLLINRGGGKFEDCSEKLIAQTSAPALAAASADFNGDGWADIYVANDNYPNHLWISQSDGSFKEEALQRGCALNWSGRQEASMGIAVADFDLNGWLDIFIAHMNDETNTLYLNQGDGNFIDGTSQSGLAISSVRHTAWSPSALDYDRDGFTDLFISNGGMQIYNGWHGTTVTSDMTEPNQLFHNIGGGRFEEIDVQSFPQPMAWDNSRGVVTGDIDNDGDTDLVYSNNDGPAVVLMNEFTQANYWVGIELVSAHGSPAIGAQLELRGEQGSVLRIYHANEGYASSKDPRVIQGLKAVAPLMEVKVTWPNGQIETWTDIASDQYTILHEGTARAHQKEHGP